MSHPAFPGAVSQQDPELTSRQREVFVALVTLHGASARPVGSEALAQHARIPLSPASIRSSLAELEELGLLARTHPSAGRVPSGRLIGRDLTEVRERLAADPELVRRSAVRLVAHSAAARWAPLQPSARFSAGAGHIAEQPEFAGRPELGPLLRVVENGPPLDRLMIDGIEGHPAVRVGLDEDAALSSCSL